MSMFIKTTSGSNINFTSDYRMYAILYGLLIKFDCSEHISVICNGYRGHLELLGLIHQLVNSTGSIQKAVCCMQMQMNKIILIIHYDTLYTI